MFIVLMPRLSIPHILSYRLSNGGWRTICNKILPKDATMITLSADNTYPGICRACKKRQDDDYKEELNYDPRVARNSYQSGLYYIADYITDNIISVEDIYSYLNRRKWRKLEKYKSVVKLNSRSHKKI